MLKYTNVPSYKMTTFLISDLDKLKKKIHYTNYSRYENAIINFVSKINKLPYCKTGEAIKALQSIDIRTFCNRPELYIDIASKSNLSEEEFVRQLNDLKTIIKCQNNAFCANAIWHNITPGMVKQYGYKNIETCLLNYGYFLYQEDSPIMISAQYDFDKFLKSEGIKQIDPNFYQNLLSEINKSLKANYYRLVNQLASAQDRNITDYFASRTTNYQKIKTNYNYKNGGV